MRRFGGRAIVAAAAAVIGASACQLLVKLDGAPEQRDATVAPLPDAAPDAMNDPCALTIPEPPPDDVGADRDDLRFAVVRWQVEGNTDDELCGSAGLNIDGLTTRGDASTCEIDRACVPYSKGAQEKACDQPGGVDNAIRNVLGDFAALANNTALLQPDDPQTLLQTGRVNFLVEIKRYNGTANDRDVTVNLYAAAGLVQPNDAGVIPVDLNAASDAQPAAPPTLPEMRALPRPWDGGAGFAWIIDSKTLRPQPGQSVQIAKRSEPGYVRDYTLVIQGMGPFEFPYSFGLLGGGGIPSREGTLVVRLLPPSAASGGRWKMTHGRFVARAANNDLLSMVGASRSPFDAASPSNQICENVDLYLLVKDVICKALDLRADNDAGEKCTQESGAISFASVQTDFATLPGGELWTADTNLLGHRLPCATETWMPCDDCNLGFAHCELDGGRIPADAAGD